MPSLQGADAPQWVDAEPKPMNDAPRAGTGPPRVATGREPARRACPTYWLALTLVVGGAGAIVPLYLRESVTQARIQALENFTDTVGRRAGLFRPRARAPHPASLNPSSYGPTPEPARGSWAGGPF